ncbi:MAG: Cold shock protein CspB [candidate division BRC1 bacterium ADurb.BinA364]|nr:MAG: Cold shock protein CspB [candidate division BRC1 bacterium ADurb.BinA364]
MHTGTVKFFHDRKGWGFIEREGCGDAFVHFNDIEGEGYRTLARGEKVVFELVQGPKGDKAIRVARRAEA